VGEFDRNVKLCRRTGITSAD